MNRVLILGFLLKVIDHEKNFPLGLVTRAAVRWVRTDLPAEIQWRLLRSGRRHVGEESTEGSSRWMNHSPRRGAQPPNESYSSGGLRIRLQPHMLFSSGGIRSYRSRSSTCCRFTPATREKMKPAGMWPINMQHGTAAIVIFTNPITMQVLNMPYFHSKIVNTSVKRFPLPFKKIVNKMKSCLSSINAKILNSIASTENIRK